jgi:adenylate kinase
MNLIILGAPGSGKGTQAARIRKRLGVPSISTGDIFRDNISRGTELGKEARIYIEHGELVPDDIVISIALDRIDEDDCKNGFLLDGFPRTMEQAKALERHLTASGRSLDRALLIDVPTDELVYRIVGRFICSDCGISYHVPDMPPARDGVCDACGGELKKRGDDNEVKVRTRIEVYKASTVPLVDYYGAKNLIVRIVGTTGPDAVFADIVKALDI